MRSVNSSSLREEGRAGAQRQGRGGAADAQRGCAGLAVAAARRGTRRWRGRTLPGCTPSCRARCSACPSPAPAGSRCSSAGRPPAPVQRGRAGAAGGAARGGRGGKTSATRGQHSGSLRTPRLCARSQRPHAAPPPRPPTCPIFSASRTMPAAGVHSLQQRGRKAGNRCGPTEAATRMGARARSPQPRPAARKGAHCSTIARAAKAAAVGASGAGGSGGSACSPRAAAKGEARSWRLVYARQRVKVVGELRLRRPQLVHLERHRLAGSCGRLAGEGGGGKAARAHTARRARTRAKRRRAHTKVARVRPWQVQCTRTDERSGQPEPPHCHRGGAAARESGSVRSSSKPCTPFWHKNYFQKLDQNQFWRTFVLRRPSSRRAAPCARARAASPPCPGVRVLMRLKVRFRRWA